MCAYLYACVHASVCVCVSERETVRQIDGDGEKHTVSEAKFIF